MEYTEYYKFRKPTKAVDIVKIGDINFNSEKIDELIHSTQVSLAPAYDATRTSENPYMTGDVVMKDALMYKCLEDDVYGAWDATKWERTTAGEEGAGGSSVEANPQGTPTDDLDTIGINGTIYNIAGSGGGGGNVYGAFIDINRVIQAETAVSAGTRASYIAPEDCFVRAKLWRSSTAGTSISIDGVEVFTNYSTTGTSALYATFPIKAGQTLTVDATAGQACSYTIYGLTFGTQNIFTPQIYSLEERVVGVWVDNKPLYAKTYDLTNQALTNNAWNNNILGTSGINIKAYDGYFNLGTAQWFPYSYYRGSTEFFTSVNGGADVSARPNMNAGTPIYAGIVTILYTKDSDIAGSGEYNTLGVPMVHYSTTEHVIGTDESGNTIYEITLPTVTLTSTNTQTDISALNVDEIIDIQARYKQGNGAIQFINEYNDGEDWLSTQISSNNIRTLCKAWFINNGFTAKYTIRYTKSS